MFYTDNHIGWLEYYLEHEFFKISNFKNPSPDYNGEFVLCSHMDLPASQIAHDAAKYFSINNVISLINKGKTSCESFLFGSTLTTNDLTNYYLSNIGHLRNFTYYFKSKGNMLLEKMESNQLLIYNPPPPKKVISTINYHNLKSEFMEDVDKFYFDVDNKNLFLTRREIECAKYFFIGKTSEEVAMILGIAKKTVDKHIENIKKKLNCSKQSQLIAKLIKMGIFNYK